MATINSAFNLIVGALEADQSALNIVANNVANANTPGYTQQVPNWRENTSVQINGVNYGTGVSETGATSVRDRVLEERLQQQQQAASASSTRLSALNSVQALFPPDSGSESSRAGDIGADITGFFSSFASLEANPTDNSLREQVLSSARTLAGDVSNAAASLNAQRTSLDQEAASIISQVNSLTSAIAQLNIRIQSSSPTADAGSLEDERQRDLSQLSQIIGINQITTENNGISLTTTSGDMLVSEGTSYPLTTGTFNGEAHFFIGTSDVTGALTTGGGELGGYLTARDQDIPQVLSALDELAFGISTRVNALNNSGSDLSGATGTAANPHFIFSQPSAVAGSAASMGVIMTLPSEIAAATVGQGSGDNSNAAALAALAAKPIANGLTPSDFYSDFVTALGSMVSQVQTENTAQSASLTQLQTMRDSLSSVNLNDEAAFMQQFERSYQAASRVFAILNTVMSSVLNLGVATSVS
jgi:flagellar hook-associated protein 1 FlgK